jgi:hypothetical protein
MSGRSWILSTLFGLGLIAVFIGERLAGAGSSRVVLTGLGCAAVAVAVGLRVLRWRGAQGERRRIEAALLGLCLLGVGALALYFAGSELWTRAVGTSLERGWPRLAGALAVLWPALLTLAALPTFLAELAYAGMARAPKVELGRVRDAILSGAGFTAVLVFTFSAYYVASERDVKWDFSWFRTARAGEVTLNVVRSLDGPVEVSAFFPPANEVREQVMGYLKDLQAASPQLQLSMYDEALEPKRARELGVTGNGTVVIARGGRKELLSMGLELERARGQLRNLDREFQKRLMTVARGRRTVYFTVGHGERGVDRVEPTDHRWTVRVMREALGHQNLEVRDLGLADGLATEVPEDAAAVVIAGPTQSFLPEELSALERYLERGGRLLLAVDPDSDADFDALLAAYGLRLHRTMLANDQHFVPRTRQRSDRANLVTASYSSHPAVTALGRLGQKAPLILVGSGHLEGLPARPPAVRIDFTVRSVATTFSDVNGNFEHDPDERRGVFDLAAAVSRTFGAEGEPKGAEARLIVFADSDVLADPVMENPANAYLARDGLKWLVGDEELVGEVSSEQDVRIQHTRKQDVAWFYSTVFLAPLLVVGVGMIATRRSGRRRRRGGSEDKS